MKKRETWLKFEEDGGKRKDCGRREGKKRMSVEQGTICKYKGGEEEEMKGRKETDEREDSRDKERERTKDGN